MMREVAIAGVGMSKFDSFDGEKGRPYRELYDFGSEAVLKALEDADMDFKDIQAGFCGSVYQGTGAGHQVLSEIGATGIPIINIENACSSGSSALRLAYQSVATGLYDICLAAGFEKMPRGFIRSTFWREWERCLGFNIQPAQYALAAVRQMEEYGHTLRQFAKVTEKNRSNGASNPYARFQKSVTIEEVLNSRVVSKPLRLLNCCPLADGGAAAIVCDPSRVKSKAKKVTIASAVLTSEMYGTAKGSGSTRVKNPTRTELAANLAYKDSGFEPKDIDVAEVYDTMSNCELMSIAELGFCTKEEVGLLMEGGEFDLKGRLPVNTSGGLISRGHPLGATGIAQICEIVFQLRGEAGKRQVSGARVGLCHTLGAGPNASVTILTKY